MQEAPQEYTKRMLRYVEGQDVLKVQTSTAKKLAKLIQGVPPAKLRKRPAPDKWSAAEILAHLADSEIARSWRIRQALALPSAPIQSFDQDAWVTTGHYDKRAPRKSIELFRALREANLLLLSVLSPEQQKISITHPERGPESIEHMHRIYAGHDLNHTHQIELILRKPKSPKAERK